MYATNKTTGDLAQAVAYSLHYGGKILAWVKPDSEWPGLWRIHWPDGSISDLTNLSRAKHAAVLIAADGPPERSPDCFRRGWVIEPNANAQKSVSSEFDGNSDPKAGKAPKKKLSRTAQWMLEHPDDEPCPTGPRGDYQARRAAREWRKKRGVILEPGARKQRAKYEAAMEARK
jgi:hypothetical protein